MKIDAMSLVLVAAERNIKSVVWINLMNSVWLRLFCVLPTNLKNEAHIKQCLHPNKDECDEKIIKAHAIQNNRTPQ